MKKIIILLTILPFLFTSLYASQLSGDYSCKMSFWEIADYDMVEGEDFPRAINYLSSPRKRNVNLSLSFDQKQVITANNAASSLPNFLLLTNNNQQNQRSLYHFESNSYEIYWYGVWYYGASLNMEVLSQDKNSFVAEFFFDDNDGHYIRVKKVTCLRLL